jgi:glyoxylase-like metal-dependent hydrolase (beta-lactamase superfamily II)
MREVQQALGGEFRMHPADRLLLAMLSEQGAMFGFPPAEAPEAVRDLTDGEIIPLGEEALEVIHTPGHSPGGVCFHAGNDLWVGDTLFAGSVGRTDLPGASFKQLSYGIHTRLFPLGDAVRCWTGHGEPTTLGEERLNNPFVGEAAGRP